MVERILAFAPGERVTIFAPVVRGRKGEFKDLSRQARPAGLPRARRWPDPRPRRSASNLEKRKNHTIEAIVYRAVLKPGIEKGPRRLRRKSPADGQRPRPRRHPSYDEQLYSSSMACPDCGLDVPKLEPRSFSFNSTYGACPECHGLGSIYDFDPAKIITDWSKPLLDGGLGPGSASQYLIRLINLAAQALQNRPQAPLRTAHLKATGAPPLRPAPGRSPAHRLPRHPRLAPRFSR